MISIPILIITSEIVKIYRFYRFNSAGSWVCIEMDGQHKGLAEVF